MRRHLIILTISFSLIAQPVHAQSYSKDFFTFLGMLSQTFSRDPVPFGQANVRKYGGRNSYCLKLGRAIELDAGVKLPQKKFADYMQACNFFLKSKGIK